VTIGDPEARLRDDGVGTVVSGESHVCFCFLRRVLRSVSKASVLVGVSKLTL
jgi:hypothetical protein